MNNDWNAIPREPSVQIPNIILDQITIRVDRRGFEPRASSILNAWFDKQLCSLLNQAYAKEAIFRTDLPALIRQKYQGIRNNYSHWKFGRPWYLWCRIGRWARRADHLLEHSSLRLVQCEIVAFLSVHALRGSSYLGAWAERVRTDLPAHSDLAGLCWALIILSIFGPWIQ